MPPIIRGFFGLLAGLLITTVGLVGLFAAESQANHFSNIEALLAAIAFIIIATARYE